jgi:hypothetical protein
MDRKDPKRDRHNCHTIRTLRLDIKAAEEGKTWKLLPEGFRDQDCGRTYPLPTRWREIQKIAAIYLPAHAEKRDCGCFYIRRAIREWTSRQEKKQSILLDLGRREQQITKRHEHFNEKAREREQEARDAVENVREEAKKAVASLTDLFALARKGIDGQMRAHILGAKWHGEKISAAGFRDCFRIVAQAVKGLGLPSDQRAKAEGAILEEAAAAIKAMKESLELSPTAKTGESRLLH